VREVRPLQGYERRQAGAHIAGHADSAAGLQHRIGQGPQQHTATRGAMAGSWRREERMGDDRVYGESQGLITRRSIPSKSLTFLVARGTPWVSAVAAITASAVAIGRASRSRCRSTEAYQ